jgi:xanthine dehydrogenase iron-sulfur cluster and FAD-binding subunit A
MEEIGAQCGICTPGMVLTTVSLGARPSLARIREGLAGNLCRCTGYEAIYRAVQRIS